MKKMPLAAHNRDRIREALSNMLSHVRAHVLEVDAIHLAVVGEAKKAIQIVDSIELPSEPSFKASHEAFRWGEIKAEHRIGPYYIIEYKPRHELQERLFHAFFIKDGRERDTHESFYSLEAAIIGAIAHGRGERGATMYALRMLGLKTDE